MEWEAHVELAASQAAVVVRGQAEAWLVRHTRTTNQQWENMSRPLVVGMSSAVVMRETGAETCEAPGLVQQGQRSADWAMAARGGFDLDPPTATGLDQLCYQVLLVARSPDADSDVPPEPQRC